MTRSHRILFIAVGLVIGFGVPPLKAQVTVEPKPSQWALLIAVENYHKAPKLQFTNNDVRRIRDTLIRRGGFLESHIVAITDEEKKTEAQPLKKSLEAALPEFLKKPGPKDTVIVFFSGHGFRDADGKLYLAPQDIDPAKAAATGISIEWFRGLLDACPANFKLVVLDACHAGSEKGEEPPATSVSGKDFADKFSNLEGVATIASSTADEKSLLWDEKEQSLFSYWLNQALKGHADENADAAIDIDELHKYVHRQVVATSKARFPRVQTPVRIVRPGTTDVPTVIRLNGRTLRQVLADNAELLADQVDKRIKPKIGVLEFTDNVGGIELLGANFGALGKWSTMEFEQKLMAAGADRFEIIDQRRLQNVLKEEDFAIDDLGSSERMARLSTKVDGLSFVAIGTMTARQGRRVVIQCSLMGLDFKKLGTASGVAALNESEWAMLGRSVTIKFEDRRVDYSAARTPAKPVSVIDLMVSRAEQRSQISHPLREPQFQFPITVKVRRADRPKDTPQAREFVFKTVGEGDQKREECFLPVRKGEVVELWIGNRTKDRVTLRCLVDGLNTLPEEEISKGITTWITGKRVNLDAARPWVIDPKNPNLTKVQGVPTFAIRGFVSEVGSGGKAREFTVVDAERSLAARQNFTDQIGIITAAFYTAEAGGTRGNLGIDAGREVSQDIRVVNASAGKLLSVVHIRYVDADTLSASK